MAKTPDGYKASSKVIILIFTIAKTPGRAGLNISNCLEAQGK